MSHAIKKSPLGLPLPFSFSLLFFLAEKMSPSINSVTDKKPFIYDLISDTATVPTDEMFEIMKAATRGDDVYQVRKFFLLASI